MYYRSDRVIGMMYRCVFDLSMFKMSVNMLSKVFYPRKICTAVYLPSLQRLSSTIAEVKYGDKLRRKAEE